MPIQQHDGTEGYEMVLRVTHQDKKSPDPKKPVIKNIEKRMNNINAVINAAESGRASAQGLALLLHTTKSELKTTGIRFYSFDFNVTSRKAINKALQILQESEKPQGGYLRKLLGK